MKVSMQCFMVSVVSMFCVACSSLEELADSIANVFGTSVEVSVLRPAKQDLSGINSIVVANIGGSAGKRAKMVLLKELGSTTRFKVLSRDDLKYSLEELSFGQSGLANKKTVKKIGRMLGADALIVGNVDLSYQKTNSSKTNTSKDGKRSTTYTQKGLATLDGALGIINLETGEYRAFESVNAQATDIKSELNSRPEEPNRAKAEQNALHSGVKRFVRQVSPYYEVVKLKFEPAKTSEGKKGIKYIKAGLWDEGIGLLQQEAKNNPDHAGSWYNLGVVSQYKNDFPSAKNAFNKCIVLSDKKKYVVSLSSLKDRIQEYETLESQFPGASL